MRLVDLVRQAAADAIVLKQQQSGGTFLMRATPLDVLGEERADRAHAAVKHVHDGETLDDVDAVALRIMPDLVRLTAEKK